MTKESCLNCGKPNEILFCSECKEKWSLTSEKIEELRLSMKKVLEIEKGTMSIEDFANAPEDVKRPILDEAVRIANEEQRKYA